MTAERIPISRRPRRMRTAISPRLAIRTFRMRRFGISVMARVGILAGLPFDRLLVRLDATDGCRYLDWSIICARQRIKKTRFRDLIRLRGARRAAHVCGRGGECRPQIVERSQSSIPEPDGSRLRARLRRPRRGSGAGGAEEAL